MIQIQSKFWNKKTSSIESSISNSKRHSQNNSYFLYDKSSLSHSAFAHKSNDDSLELSSSKFENKLLGLGSLMNCNPEKGDFEMLVERRQELTAKHDNNLMKFGTQVEHQHLSFSFGLSKQK